MRFAVLKFLACSIGLGQALVIPEINTVDSVLPRNVALHDSHFIVPRAGKCPRVNLVRGKKPKPSVPKKPLKTSSRNVEEELAFLSLEERTDKKLEEMNEIASFEWAIGDTATTIGLHGCSVIALYDDKEIVWGHYSPGTTLPDGEFLDHQGTLGPALAKIEAKARAVGILAAGKAKGVVRIDRRAAAIEPPPGIPNIPTIIATWFLKLGVRNLNRATYNVPLPLGRCIIEHPTSANGEAKVTMA